MILKTFALFVFAHTNPRMSYHLLAINHAGSPARPCPSSAGRPIKIRYCSTQSNIIRDNKIVAFQDKYISYLHNVNIIVFTVLTSAKWVWFQLASVIIKEVTYSSMLNIFQLVVMWISWRINSINEWDNFSNNDVSESEFDVFYWV